MESCNSCLQTSKKSQVVKRDSSVVKELPKVGEEYKISQLPIITGETMKYRHAKTNKNTDVGRVQEAHTYTDICVDIYIYIYICVYTYIYTSLRSLAGTHHPRNCEGARESDQRLAQATPRKENFILDRRKTCAILAVEIPSFNKKSGAGGETPKTCRRIKKRREEIFTM